MIICDLQYLEVVDDQKISHPTTQINTTQVKGGLVSIGSFAFATAEAQDFTLSQVAVGTVSFTFPVQ